VPQSAPNKTYRNMQILLVIMAVYLFGGHYCGTKGVGHFVPLGENDPQQQRELRVKGVENGCSIRGKGAIWQR
jgi:hypothetical protein